MSEGFPKESRLRKKFEFNKVFNRSLCTFKNKYYSLYAVKNNTTIPRVGISVSKRSIKKAVSRNCLKRIIREVFRKNKDRFSGVDFVVVIKRNIEDKKEFAKTLINSFQIPV